MPAVLNFADLACLNDSAAGSLGAGMASAARAGFALARGFVITPQAFAEFLKRQDIAAAMDMHRSGAESPEDSWRALKAQFSASRLAWNHEMDILTAYSGIGGAVSLASSTALGSSPPVYASTAEDVLAGAKHCWLAWLKSFSGGPDAGNLPAVIVREVMDAEVSVELYRKGQGLRARAVFGLPEGLYDPAVSADQVELGSDGRPARTETRPQSQQFIPRSPGPARVPVAQDFRSEAKLSEDMAGQLAPAIDFMRQNPVIASVTVCFVSSRPVVYSAALSAARAAPAEIPPRDRSISLMEPPAKPGRSEPAPVLAMRLYLTVSGPEDIAGLGETYADGVLVEGGAISRQEWSGAFSSFAAEARRKLNAQEMVFEIKDLAQGTLKALAEACNAARFAGAKPAVLIPGIRSPEELAKTTRTIGAALPDALRPSIWARVMYPSNLYFMDSMAADAVALDADSLGRLMLGIEGGSWADMSTQALERAIQPMLDSRKCPVAVLARDMVSMPTFLEFLVRNRADIICIRPEELKTVRHIVASVEKRMVLERGA